MPKRKVPSGSSSAAGETARRGEAGHGKKRGGPVNFFLGDDHIDEDALGNDEEGDEVEEQEEEEDDEEELEARETAEEKRVR